MVMPEEIIIHNPHATMPLIYGVDVVNNTDDETILSNVLVNSRRIKEWVTLRPAHHGTVLLCGSGPSIRQDLDEIRLWRANGAEIWALNNCANLLADAGILPDAQVIMDAQPRTRELIGPAKSHLFASQVHPSLFEAVPEALLWHATLGNVLVDEQEGFPVRHEDYCLIGSGITIGNTALVLAYAMGFRSIHCFGYDSSNEGDASHVLHQSINDGDVYTNVEFNGKRYISSIVMKMQADAFLHRAKMLQDAGATIAVHGYGLLPDRFNTPNEEISEQEKYHRMWAVPEYRDYSPGEQAVKTFLEHVTDRGTLLDIGCGTGRAGLKLKEAGFDVTLMDFTDNSRDVQAIELPFIQHDLTEGFPIHADYGYCCDVMEHIRSFQVPFVLFHIIQAIPQVFFQISTVPDQMGEAIHQDLHLTVKPGSWWRELIESLGAHIEWSSESPIDVQFLITSRRPHAI